MALGSEYIIKYVSDISGALTGAKQLEAVNANIAKTIGSDYAKATRILGTDLQKISSTPIKINGQEAIKTLQEIGTVVQMADGSFAQFTQKQTLVNGVLTNTTGSLKNVNNQFIKTNLEAEKGNKVFTNLTDNVKQLAGRALLTIPIWIALRGAIMGVFQGIQGGIKDLIEFDLALQKIRNNLQGTPQQVSADFKKMRAVITETSKATGISAVDIAGAVKQFATLGFSAKESLEGAQGATKLSIALFGDASETAGAFARALNIMIDRSQGAKSAADQMNEAFALTSQLEETNNFEIRNVTEALDKFAGTAAGVGLTMNQTLQILAALGTAGRQGSEGATLLSTAFNTLLTNIPKLSQNLGIVVGAGDATFDTFQKIINKVTELSNTPGGQSAAIAAISDVFGGARGIKIVQSLIAVKDILDKNIATIPSFTALQEKAQRTMETESKQVQVLGNNLTEIGKSFIRAVLGSDDMTKALIKLNDIVTKLGTGLNGLGTVLHAVFSNLGLIAGAAFLIGWQKAKVGQLLLTSMKASAISLESAGTFLSFAFSRGFLTGCKFLGKFAATSIVTGFTGVNLVGALGKIIAGVFSAPAVIAMVAGKMIIDAFFDGWEKRINEKNNKINELSDTIVNGLKGQLSNIDLTTLIEKLTVELPKDKVDLIKAKEIGALRAQLQKQVQAGIDSETIKLQPQIDVSPILSIEESNKIKQELITKELDEQQNIAKLILNNKLDELKTNGASNVQLAQAKILGTAQLGIEEDKVSLLGQQLDLEKAIQEEKRLQNKLGSDSLKLFDIAQSDGVETAKKIGEVLSGNTSFQDFVRRGGKELEIFKTQFADTFKQQQAEQFFKGERVSQLPTLRRGDTIAIQEEALRSPETRQSTIDAAKAVSDKLTQQKQLQTILNLQTSIPIELNTTIDVTRLNEMVTEVAKRVSEQGNIAGTEVNKMLIQFLNGKQGYNQ
jgi:TP901 family phage tail tape measure protein